MVRSSLNSDKATLKRRSKTQPTVEVVAEPSRFSKKVKSLHLDPVTLIVSGVLILGGFMVLMFSLNGVTHIFDTPKITKIDPLEATGGYVKNSDHKVNASIVRFNQAIERTGMATTVVALDGNVIAATLAPNGDIDILSRDTALPHYIKALGIQYRQINPISNANAGLLDTPINDTWTTDMTAVQSQVDQYLRVINPANLLSSLLPYMKIVTADAKSDGSIIVALKGLLSGIPAEEARLHGFPIATDQISELWIYADISNINDLTRLMIVFPDGNPMLISTDGPALKPVTKPDLTRVVPNLNLPTVSPSPTPKKK